MNGTMDAEPVLYSEDELVPVEGTQAKGAPSLVGDLLAAETADRREALIRRSMQDMGFEWLGYGTMVQQREGIVPKSFFTTYGHAQWTQRYFTERYHEVDPRHKDAPRSSLPLVWDIHDIDASALARQASGRVRRFADDFRDSGIRSGVFFQLPSPTAANERTVISLMASAPHRGWIVDRVLGQALTLGLCLHEFLSRHTRRRSEGTSARVELSALQQDILQCLSHGQSDKEIAYRLQLSSHAVDYHMRQLRRRFAVRNRVQLVNAAT